MAEVLRSLTSDEVRQLEQQGCVAEEWSAVQVRPGFAAGPVRNARFTGTIELGCFRETVATRGGLRLPSGIENAHLHNCVVEDNVRIANIGRYISNYRIAAGARIENTDLLAVSGLSAFGNGTLVNTMVEAGGRTIPIFDRLSCQMAYLMVFRRDRPDLFQRLRKMVEDYTASIRSETGTVGARACVVGCGQLINLQIGPSSVVDGALRLENGTLASTLEDPVRIGSGVIAHDFLAASGAQVQNGAQLDHCFVGQAVRISNIFHAEHSLFFANADMQRGEACSIYAGPYATSHHKSTLLLTAHYSFFNAGSGSNFSNHMYKLGPVHQGVLERGCKTGSSSYLPWPGQVGPFSVVLGTHKSHIDVSAFPFSYLIGDSKGSTLIPGANLYTAGLQRDSAKWLDRDRRKDPDPLDAIHPAIFTPYTIGRMLAARDLLAELQTHTPIVQESVNWHGAQIPRNRLQRSWEDYDLAILLYLGSKVAACIEAILTLSGKEDLPRKLTATKSWGLGTWCDFGGLVVPEIKVEQLMDAVLNGTVDSAAQLQSAVKELQANYTQMEWNWVLTTWLAELEKTPESLTLADVEQTLRRWQHALEDLSERVLADAAKEFDVTMQYSYGLEGDEETRAADFDAVRGSLDTNAFVQSFEAHIEKKLALAGRLLEEVFGN